MSFFLFFIFLMLMSPVTFNGAVNFATGLYARCYGSLSDESFTTLNPSPSKSVARRLEAVHEGVDLEESFFMEERDFAIQSLLQASCAESKKKCLRLMDALFGEDGFCLTGMKTLLQKDDLCPSHTDAIKLCEWESSVNLLPIVTEKGKKHPFWHAWVQKVRRFQDQLSGLSEVLSESFFRIGELMIDRYGLELDVQEERPLIFMSETQKPWACVENCDLQGSSLATYNQKSMDMLNQLFECKNQFSESWSATTWSVTDSSYTAFKKCVDLMTCVLSELKTHATQHCNLEEFNDFIACLQKKIIVLPHCEKCSASQPYETWLKGKGECEKALAEFVARYTGDLSSQENLEFKILPQSPSLAHNALFWSQCQMLLASQMLQSALSNSENSLQKNLWASHLCRLTTCMLMERGEIPIYSCSDFPWIYECESKIVKLLALTQFQTKEDVKGFLEALFGENGFCVSGDKKSLMRSTTFPHVKYQSVPFIYGVGCTTSWAEIRDETAKALPLLTEKGKGHPLWSKWLERIVHFEESFSLSSCRFNWESLGNIIQDLMLDRYGLELPMSAFNGQATFVTDIWLPRLIVFRDGQVDNKSQKDLALFREIAECKQKYKVQRKADFGALYILFQKKVLRVRRALKSLKPYVLGLGDWQKVNALIRRLETGEEIQADAQENDSVRDYSKQIEMLSCEVWPSVKSKSIVSAQSSATLPWIPAIQGNDQTLLFWKQVKTLLAIRIFYNKIVPAIQSEEIRGIFSEKNVCAMAADLLVLLGEGGRQPFYEESGQRQTSFEKSLCCKRKKKVCDASGKKDVLYNPFC